VAQPQPADLSAEIPGIRLAEIYRKLGQQADEEVHAAGHPGQSGRATREPGSRDSNIRPTYAQVTG